VGNTKGSGTTTFIKQLYNTAGPCIECDHRECLNTEESFDAYTVTALEYSEKDGLTCGRNGLALRNYDDTSDTSVIVDNDDIDGRTESDSHNDKHKQEKDINTISKYRSKQRNAVHIDIVKTHETESDDIYNMILPVKEDIITQPQHLKKEPIDIILTIKNQNKVEVETIHGFEEKERPCCWLR
jgi:hypothetical protein